MIVQEPNPILHRECRGVNFKEAKALNKLLRREYDDYQKDHPEIHVVGMAAPQVGKTVRAFLAFGELFINPVIVKKSARMITVREGCCSLADHQFETHRHETVFLHWYNIARQLRTHDFTGSQAAIVQHELDHLKGVLISDHGKQIEVANDRATVPQVPQAD